MKQVCAILIFVVFVAFSLYCTKELTYQNPMSPSGNRAIKDVFRSPVLALSSNTQPSTSPGAPVLGGRISPDGKIALTCDLPESERKENIASRGLGCCVFRSGDYSSRFQQVPEFYDLPEKMVEAGIPGGGYPEKVNQVFQKFGPKVQFIQNTTGDPDILRAILKTGRMGCTTYNGHDPHYGNRTIAHMVCLVCFDEKSGWAAISDNNYPSAHDFVWMSCAEFVKRWKGTGGGWVYALLNPAPPPVPHN